MNIEQVKQLSEFERLCYFIQERESIRLKKERGEARPFTDDAILQSYRFCNVRRLDDRVSQWLLKNWYEPYFDHPNSLLAAALARFVNLPSSLGRITELVYHSNVPAWNQIKATLREAKKEGPIFNGAYMVRGNDGMDKVECVVDYYVRPLTKLIPQINRDSMEKTWDVVLESYGMGSFMAGQVVADLRWAMKGEWKDKHVWAPMGPGSAKGMNRVHGRDPKAALGQSRFLKELLELIDRLDKVIPQSITSRMEAIDFQNCCCELSKFEKALWGEGSPKQKYPGNV